MMVTLAMAIACGSTDDDAATLGAKDEPIDCGDLTCSEDEMCLVFESSPLGVSFDTYFECALIPSGCEGASFCDCGGTEGDFNGQPIAGCVALGTRELTVTDDSCGTAPCAEGEGCIAFGWEFSSQGDITENYCHPLPDGCAASLEFCDSGCAELLADSAGETYSGCVGSEAISGVLVEERP